MAAIRFYLRPVADVRVDHSLDTTTAESGVGGFAALNEEVKDSGCISASRAKEDKEWYSIFRLGGSVPTDEEFTSMKFCVHFGDEGAIVDTTLGSIGDENFGITVNGQTEYVSGSKDKMGLVTFELSSSLTAVKNYLAANGTFPPIEIIIYTWMSGYGDDKAFRYRYYYQAYIELSTEMGIHHKVGGGWATSGKAYERVNGSWKKISKDATKSILTSKLLKSGHEAIAIAGYNPTCTSEGLSTGYKCNKCGKELISQVVIPALGHSPVTIAGYAATCATAGLTNGSKCTRCGATLVPQEVIPATGNHSYVESGGFDEVCTVCGYINGYGNGTMSYYGTATSLSSGRNNLAATSVGNYALFGGGGDITDVNATVDAYDQSLTRSTPPPLSLARGCLAATSVGNYALFGGGYESNVVDVYDLSLTRTVSDPLCVGRRYLAATSVGNYALFGGGDGKAEVDAYNTSLVHTAPLYLSADRYNLAATSIGNYALFGGGQDGITSMLNIVDAYNQSLTRSAPTPLSEARATLAATSVGNYALFGGGNRTGSQVGSTVDAYNQSLTRSTPTALNNDFVHAMATTIGNYALFAINGTGDDDTDVYAYNHSLTRTSLTALSSRKGYGAATIVGSYALFGGDFKKTGIVDAYQIKF